MYVVPTFANRIFGAKLTRTQTTNENSIPKRCGTTIGSDRFCPQQQSFGYTIITIVKMSTKSDTKRILSDNNGPRDSVEPKAKKPRKKLGTAKTKSLTQKDLKRIEAGTITKKLSTLARKLVRQVNQDWHDGYEDQLETKLEWHYALKKPLQAVLDIGVGKGEALEECNEVLKIVSDSWYDLLAVNCRIATLDELCEAEAEFTLKLPWGGSTFHVRGCPAEAWSYVWVALLRTHCAKSNADEELLLQCIKDASDSMKDAEYMTLPGFLYDEDDEDFDE